VSDVRHQHRSYTNVLLLLSLFIIQLRLSTSNKVCDDDDDCKDCLVVLLLNFLVCLPITVNFCLTILCCADIAADIEPAAAAAATATVGSADAEHIVWVWPWDWDSGIYWPGSSD